MEKDSKQVFANFMKKNVFFKVIMKIFDDSLKLISRISYSFATNFLFALYTNFLILAPNYVTSLLIMNIRYHKV